MAYENLKAAIKQAIKQNGNQEITGDTLQSTLLSMLTETVEQGYAFAGFADLTTQPKTSDSKKFYIFNNKGLYAGFNITIETEKIGIFITDDGSNWTQQTLMCIDQDLRSFSTTAALSQAALKKLLTERSSKIPILNHDVCVKGTHYHDICSMFVDLEIYMPERADNKIGLTSVSISNNKLNLTAYFVDSNGHYIDAVHGHAFTSLGPIDIGCRYVSFNTRGDTNKYGFKFEIRAIIDMDVARQLNGLSAYVPSMFSDEVFTSHEGPINNARIAASQYTIDCNRFGPLVQTTQFLSAGGLLSGDSNYKGYMSDFISVQPGEEYRCYTAFQGYGNSFKGNIFGYKHIDDNHPIVLGGGIQDYKKYNIITIPDNIYYIRACSNKLSPLPYIVRNNSLTSEFIDGLNKQEEIVSRGLINMANILNGKKIVYITQKDLQRISSSYTTIYDSMQSMTVSSSSIISDSWFNEAKSFTPSGKNLVHIKFKLTFNTEATKLNNIVVWISGTHEYSADKSYPIAHLAKSGDYDITFDPAFYSVYHNMSSFYVWIAYKASTADARSFTIENFEVFELEGSLVKEYVSGSNVQELFESVNNAFVNIASMVAPDFKLISPSGNNFTLGVSDDGTLYSIPAIPDKGYFFGNSLITGSGFGMAASDAQHDYYYLINSYIKNVNSDYTYNKSSGTAFEGIEDKSLIDTSVENLVSRLSGDETLVSIQLGDNVNTSAKNLVFPDSSLALCKAIRKKCPRARVIWMGMWYSSESKYAAIKNACNKTGCKFISYEDIKGDGTSSYIGATQNQGFASRTLQNVTNIKENLANNITITFTVSGKLYNTTLDDVTSYSLSDSVLTYTSKYSIITSPGVASHPGNEGFRRIANKFLFELGLTNDNEYYKKE